LQWRSWKSILLALAILVIGVACDPPRLLSTELPATVTASPQPTAVPAPTEVAPSPIARNLVIALPDEPASLDPQLALSSSSFEITRNLYETLLRVDEHGVLQPHLAERWGLSADQRSLIFRLKKDRRFGNGRAINGSDVVFSLERLTDPDIASPRSKDYAAIESITVSNTYTVTVRLKAPDATMPVDLAADWAAIVPEEAAFRLGDRPIGTGPFELGEWVRGNYLSLHRVTPLSDTSLGPDDIIFRIIPDDAARVDALRTGAVDVALRIPAASVADLRSNPDVVLAQQAANQVKVVAFNQAQPPFNDVRVRRALCYAADRTALVQSVWPGLAAPVGSELSPAMPGYVDLTPQYAYNPTQARALLHDAGVTNGLSVTITIPRDEEYQRIAAAIAGQWSAAGVQAEVQPIDWTVFVNQVYFGRQFSVAVMTHVGRLDPAQALGRYATGAPSNYVGYANLAYDRLLQQSVAEPFDKRPETFASLQRMLSDDAVALYLAAPLVTTGLRKNVKDYRMLPTGGSDLSQARKE
jgi:peptide/nickel transport system substrate-binding protein